jgi:hypothetical protein
MDVQNAYTLESCRLMINRKNSSWPDEAGQITGFVCFQNRHGSVQKLLRVVEKMLNTVSNVNEDFHLKQLNST